MFFVYGDISGEPQDRIMAAACYLGKQSDIEKANAQWQAILDEVGPDTRFHATDFFGGWKSFRGWNPRSERHARLAERFAGVACDNQLIGFSFAVDNLAFGQVLAPVLTDERRQFSAEDLRVFCAMRCIAMVARFLSKANNSNPPAHLKGAFKIILEEESGGARYQNFFSEAQARKEKWTWWFSGIEFGSKKVLPLQMADLLAYQSWHRARDLARDKNAPLRPAFARMLRGERIEMEQLAEKDAQANALLFREVLRTHSEGLITDAELERIRDVGKKPSLWKRLFSRVRHWWRRNTSPK
jgi:hypothetical protein